MKLTPEPPTVLARQVVSLAVHHGILLPAAPRPRHMLWTQFPGPFGTDFAVARGLQTHLMVDTELRKRHNALDVELSIRRIREAMEVRHKP
jgi:hypothetical protein